MLHPWREKGGWGGGGRESISFLCKLGERLWWNVIECESFKSQTSAAETLFTFFFFFRFGGAFVAEPCSWSRIISAGVKFTQVEARKGWKSSETTIRLWGANELSLLLLTSSASSGAVGVREGSFWRDTLGGGCWGKTHKSANPVCLHCPGRQG